MPIHVSEPGELQVGDFFEDCAYHPCLCIEVGDSEDVAGVYGISLVNGSGPRGCNIRHCGLRKLTLHEAIEWRLHGPRDVELPLKERWWLKTTDKH